MNNTPFTNSFTFFSVIIIFDPLLIALGIKLFPSILLPRIAKKISYFFNFVMSN